MTQIVKILTGHTSPETAFLIEDYPYGRTVRTQKRVWIEEKKSKGYRYMEQTKNPKTGVWNKPAASTYSAFGMAMFLDERGYVEYKAVNEGSRPEDLVAFIRLFGMTPMLKAVIMGKIKYEVTIANAHAAGINPWTVNGKHLPLTDRDIAEHAEALAFWESAGREFGILKVK